MMLLGRIIFGFGGESLTVCQCAILSQWFRNKELTLAMGVNISFSRVGSSLNSYISPKLYAMNDDLNLPLLVGVGITFISLVCGLVVCWLDKRAENLDRAVREARAVERQGVIEVEPPKDDSLEADEGEEEVLMREAETVRCAAYRDLSLRFWLLALICLVGYGALMPFTNIVNDFLNNRYGFTPTTAGDLIIIIYLGSALITPVIGMTVDRKGGKGYLLIVSFLLQIAAHFVFMMTGSAELEYWEDIPAILGLSLLGLNFGMISSVLWPCVPLVVKARYIGTAFGLIMAV